MCWRSASDYELYARKMASSAPANGKRSRSLVEALRDLFRPRRPEVAQAEVVPFSAQRSTRTDREVKRESSEAA